MEAAVAIALVLAVVAFVTVPFWTGFEAGEDPRIVELETRKQVKYREIRDLELDHASGKLSQEEFERQRAILRSEAIETLRELDAARGAERLE